jgi:hypothetical protein
MFKFFNRLKELNRLRVTARRNVKFQTVLSNEFDRACLQLDALKLLIANTISYKEQRNGAKEFAVYSTFFGNSNAKTFNKADIDHHFDHIFISNNQQILETASNRGWHPIYLDLPVSANRVLSAQQSKIPKALPHFFPALHHYDSLLYVDDKISFNASKMYRLSQTLIRDNKAFMIREHPSLTHNILNELAVAMIQPRYQAQRDQMVAYIDAQIKSGLQLRVDHLFWTSAILRNMRHSDIHLINEDWYDAILRCGIECQITFDFVAQKYNSITLMPQTII